MNDNDLKAAFSRLTEGVDPGRVTETVRAKTAELSSVPRAERKEYTGMKGRTRKIAALCCALVAVLTAVAAAAPVIGNYLNARSVKTAERLTEVPEGWIGVYSVEDLDAVRNDLRGYYILMEDLFFEEEDFRDGGRFPGGWTPIGTRLDPFYGIFDGNGHTIDGLAISVPAPGSDEERFETNNYLESEYAGLFGYAASNPETESEIFGAVYEEEVEMDINGDGILDKVTVTTEPERRLLHFGDWGQSGTIRNLRLENGSLRMVYPAKIYGLNDNSGVGLYALKFACAGPVAGYADYVLGCEAVNFTVSLEPAGDALFSENTVGGPIVKEVLGLAAGGIAGQSYLIDSCHSGAEISVSVPGNMPEDCEVNAGGICGLATACVTSYFDGSVDCAGDVPDLCRIRTDDVPRFLPADVMDEITLRLLYVGVDPTGTVLIRPENYDELTETVRSWGVTSENLYEYMEDIRALVGNGRFDGFQTLKFHAFYRSDDPFDSDISADTVQDHYTEEAAGMRTYILDPEIKPREYRELSRLITAAFPDGDFKDFCRERGVKYGIYYVYDLGKDPECSFEGFDFESVWFLEDGTPVLRIFR